MQVQLVSLNKLKNNTGQIEGLPKNPRFIKDDKFKKLVKSIQEDPEMLDLREVIAYDNNGELIVIAGNMRLRACQELGIKEVPTKILPQSTPVQKLKAYTIKDNVAFGEHNWDDLANNWDEIQLTDWGLDIPDFNKGIDNEEGEIKISTELDQHSNYIVLKFNTDIDWLQVQSIFGLESTYSLRQNGKTWSKGVGRVIDGIDAILKIKESSNEG